MDKKIDLRVIKTYNKLTVAFGEMMKTVSFDEITVFDLCEKAEVRRATFYKHFDDKYDFFKNLVNIILTNIDKKVSARTKSASTTDYIIIFVKEIIAYLNARPEILNNILNSNAFPVMFDIITSCTHESLKKHLEDEIRSGTPFPTDAETFSSFINGGIATLLISAFKDNRTTEEEILERIDAILKKIF